MENIRVQGKPLRTSFRNSFFTIEITLEKRRIRHEKKQFLSSLVNLSTWMFSVKKPAGCIAQESLFNGFLLTSGHDPNNDLQEKR
ncbi:hypothetical protein RRG08_040880 [Elysia crispata]|uniref:Uncharacterized protein n=1 Tax=Elysia crispata TaxID=231223 RepID=A0AAE1B0Q2_9GAST|nr:hypothetical protein RRG08_040880 [Elysia crispata]